MKKFNLIGTVTISIYTEVEAENLEQAKEIAESRYIEASRWGDKTQKKTLGLQMNTMVNL